jgi:undecaprenyl diphosphate synthase
MSKNTVSTNPDLPRHVAIIMDGNGRWATSRGLPRTMGHQKGAEAVRRVVESAADMGIDYLTLFGFSSENWKRPAEEVSELLRLLRYYLRAETAELHKSGIRLRVIGRRSDFDDDIIKMIDQAEDLTKDNTKLTLMIALNYGGRMDLLHAAEQLADHAVRAGKTPSREEVEALFPAMLMTAGVPDPDILIRTSGEQRISNFLLWQCAYAELVFTPTLWPDFNRVDLEQAMQDYARRERRFGGLRQKR